MRKVIINADDFGYSDGVNKGIIEAHISGIVTSTSVMVYGNAFRDTVELLNYPKISVGLHFDLPHSTITNLENEFYKQVEVFEKLLGKKPDHLDSHKHIHMLPSLKPTFKKYSEENKIPVRDFGNAKLIDSFFGFDMNSISIDALIKSLEEANGEFSEMFCHPGYSDNFLRKLSSYNDFRELELKTLTSTRVKEYIKSEDDLKLCNWKDVRL